jgi:hypothetical protein
MPYITTAVLNLHLHVLIYHGRRFTMGFFGGTAECGYIKMGWGWRSREEPKHFWSRYDCWLAVYGLMDGWMNGGGVLVGFIWVVFGGTLKRGHGWTDG